MNLQQIKDEYAREVGYENWEDVLRHHEETLYMDEIAKRYADEMVLLEREKCDTRVVNSCKATLKKAAESWDYGARSVTDVCKTKEHFTNSDNIVIL